ncbi:MAG: sigma 54-interacting transcriptional regulator [Candidatus Schekmanbacteria bacterium]|nr:sigma 54-interacting transcriptional regulator [Candidatus Schekmanbacteria bacterium]
MPVCPDWIRGRSERPADSAQSSLDTIRALLRRDYLTRADWDYALRDLAHMVREAVGASEALVAFYDRERDAWTACNSSGTMIGDAEISRQASRTILERVRQTEEPILGKLPKGVQSSSIQMKLLDSVLAVPLYRWEASQNAPSRSFTGSIYAHRAPRMPPFSDEDVALVLDIREIAQRTLSLLQYVRTVQDDLESSRSEVARLRHSLSCQYRLGNYVTRDPSFADTVLDPLRRITRADKVGLLILGPTGAGKSYLAKAFHYESSRAVGPFVVLDCSQVTSAETLAAELFGYAPQSGFAGAPPKGSSGAAAQAHGGTLFIDEISCLTLDLQQRLLGLIQTGAYAPLGGSQKHHADIQVIAATHDNLRRLVRQNRFREDLYWRIAEVTIRLPPLTDRAADIPDLAEACLKSACERFGRPEIQRIGKDGLTVLLNHDWSVSGNIRGLEHTVRRSVLLAPPGTVLLGAEHIKLETLAEQDAEPDEAAEAGGDEASNASSGVAPSREGLGGYSPSVQAVVDAMARHRYATVAAKELGISYAALIGRLRKAGLTVRDVQPGILPARRR